MVQVEKIKAEQSKLPPTPLLGRKVFLDPQEISPARATTSSLLRQTIYEQQAVEGRGERPKASDSPSSVARRLGSTVANYTPILNGSAYTRSIEARAHSGLVGVAAGLGMSSPPPALSISPPVTLAMTPVAKPASAVTAATVQAVAGAKDAESRGATGTLRPEQRSERILRKLAAQQPQERIEHLHEAVRPLLDRERERLERERERPDRSAERPGGEVGVMAEVVLQDPPLGRERLNSEARSSELRVSTGGGSGGSSRSELQAELHQPPRHHHHRLERQLSNEQLVQARRDELPQELWRERAERERRLERQTSSEQEGAGGQAQGQGQGHEARRRDRHRLDRQESSDREHSDRRST